MDVLSHVKASFAARGVLIPGERLVLAVSGGVDSMAMLSLLHRLAEAEKWPLVAAHFNHGLRGAESDGDEDFVRQAVAALGIPLLTERGEVRELQEQRKISLEMAARHLRHEFLARAARQSGSAKIVTGHHADDQVELFFVRLCRGAGVDGLGGMGWLTSSPADPQIQIARPLLDVPKRELEAYARDCGVRFRTDSSNRLLDPLRNRIRLRLLPLLTEECQPAIRETVWRTMAALRKEGELVSGLAEEWFESRSTGSWRSLPLALRRRCVAKQLQGLGVPASFDLIEALCGDAPALVNGPRDTQLRQDGEGNIRVKPKESSPSAPEPLTVLLAGDQGEFAFGPWLISWDRRRGSAGVREGQEPGREYFDADKVGPQITVRGWLAGDRFQPIGMAKPVKLQDLFTNLKIPREQRHRLPIAATESGGIFWVPGLRMGDAYKLDKWTQRVLTWRWRSQSA